MRCALFASFVLLTGGEEERDGTRPGLGDHHSLRDQGSIALWLCVYECIYECVCSYVYIKVMRGGTCGGRIEVDGLAVIFWCETISC